MNTSSKCLTMARFGEKLGKLVDRYRKRKLAELTKEAATKTTDTNTKKRAYQHKVKYTIEALLNDINSQVGIALQRQQLDGYIKGTHSPKIDAVVPLARFFNVTVDYLLDDTCDVEDPTVKTIQDLIELDADAIRTLMTMRTPETLSVLNTLLQNPEYATTMLVDMFNHSYKEYALQSNSDHLGIYNEARYSERISFAMSWVESLEKQIADQQAAILDMRIIEEEQRRQWECEHEAEAYADVDIYNEDGKFS